MHVDEEKTTKGGLHFIRCKHDGGSEQVVSACLSDVYEWMHDRPSGSSFNDDEPREESSFAKAIRSPGIANLNEKIKLKFTVWSSCGYGYGGWRSYSGPPKKEFDSSFSTIEEANERAEYVFYSKNPWDLHGEDRLTPDTDTTTGKGCRYLEVHPDGSYIWTVSVTKSGAFEYFDM